MPHGERFTGFVREGKVRLDQPDRWKAALAQLEGKPVEVSIGRLRHNRSLSQNNLMWAWYRHISQETGNDEQRLHVMFKGMFLPLEDLVLPNGETVKVVGSTRGLDTAAFGVFLDRIKAFAAQELGIALPEPDQVGAL